MALAVLVGENKLNSLTIKKVITHCTHSPICMVDLWNEKSLFQEEVDGDFLQDVFSLIVDNDWLIVWLIFVSSSWTRILPSCDASVAITRGLGPVGCGTFTLDDSQCRGYGQSKNHRSRQKIQPDGSSDTNIWLWDPSLHHLYNLQGEYYN